MRKLCIVLFLLVLMNLLHLQAEEITIPAGAPLCSDPQMTQVILLTTIPVTVPVERHEQNYWGIQPLIRNTDMYAFTIPGKGRVWYSPQILWQNNGLIFARAVLPGPMTAGIFFCLAGILLLYLRWRFSKQMFVYPGIVFLCWGLLLYMIGQTGNIIFQPIDEKLYYKIAQDILAGNFKGPWNYTIGFPLIYIPVLLFMPETHSLVDFLVAFSIVGGFFIFPLTILLCYEIFRKLYKKPQPAILSICCFLIMIYCYVFHYHWDRLTNAIDSCKACFVFPNWGDMFAVYNRITWFGYNAMSDSPSFCLMCLIIWLVISLKKPLVITALLFAFAILVRVPNIILAPFILVLLLDKYQSIFHDRRKCLQFFATGAFCFLIVSAVQLWINTRHFGKPWILPYVTHGNLQSHSYFCSGLTNSIPLLFSANCVPFIFGLSAIPFLKNVRLRFLLMSLLVPLLVFFCFYSETFNNGIRFILIAFPFLIFAFFVFFQENVLPSSRKYWITGVLTAAAICVSPCQWQGIQLPFYLELQPWGSKVAIIAAGIVILCWGATIYLIRKEKRLLFFMLICGIAYFSGTPYISVLLLPLLAFCAGKDAIRLIRYQYKKKTCCIAELNVVQN